MSKVIDHVVKHLAEGKQEAVPVCVVVGVGSVKGFVCYCMCVTVCVFG